jgi:hypothetical protein
MHKATKAAGGTAARKGLLYNAVDLVLFALMTAIVVAVVLTDTGLVVRLNTDMRAAELATYTQALLRAPAGFHVVDKAGRTDLFSVDLARFNDATVESMMTAQNNQLVAGQLILQDKTTGKYYNAYWNRKWYDIYAPITGATGSGSAVSGGGHYAVIVYDNGAVHAGELSVSLVMPS